MLRALIAVILVSFSFAPAWSAVTPGSAPTYRFDDIFGSGASGAQWVAITADGGTIGAATGVTMETAANLVNARDHMYILNGDASARSAVDAVFLVLPGTAATMSAAFSWLEPAFVDETYTQDILTDFSVYQVTKNPLSAASDGRKLWQFGFAKAAGVNVYETVRGNMIFRQNPGDAPSQTLQIPMIIANVCDGTAERNPLIFRATMRETYSGSASGNIVAYDRFAWNVVNPLVVGGSGSDWVFVPVGQIPIDANVVNYLLSTEITNYSGIRYALQRYDGLDTATLMLPSRWTIDLPAEAKDVNAGIVLDELSHIPPGLITTYDQNFNVVSGAQSIFNMYPIDPPSGYRRLNLSHPSIFGLDLGSGADSGYTVTGFQLLASDANFTQKVSVAMSVKRAEMPSPSDNVMGGDVVSHTYVAGDAINAISLDAAIPPRLTASGDVDGLLPLHITMNLPRSNRFVAPKWDSLLTEWRRTGSIKNVFSDNFSLYSHDAEGNSVDLFKWLKGKGAFERTVKVFMDEEKECVTVSFIVMLMDGRERTMALVQDKTVTTDNGYLVMKDGSPNGKWDMAFFTAPIGYVSSAAPPSGGGGGGCNMGFSMFFTLVACGFVISLRKKTGAK